MLWELRRRDVGRWSFVGKHAIRPAATAEPRLNRATGPLDSLISESYGGHSREGDGERDKSYIAELPYAGN